LFEECPAAILIAHKPLCHKTENRTEDAPGQWGSRARQNARPVRSSRHRARCCTGTQLASRLCYEGSPVKPTTTSYRTSSNLKAVQAAAQFAGAEYVVRLSPHAPAAAWFPAKPAEGIAGRHPSHKNCRSSNNRRDCSTVQAAEDAAHRGPDW